MRGPLLADFARLNTVIEGAALLSRADYRTAQRDFFNVPLLVVRVPTATVCGSSKHLPAP